MSSVRAAPLLAAAVALALLSAATTASPSRPGTLGERAPLAPDFVARTIEGGTFRLSALRGSVVVLDFQWPGCGSCELEAPLLERMAGRYGERVRFVIVDFLGSLPRKILVQYYRRSLGLARVTVVHDPRRQVARAYRVRFAGTTYVVGRDGRIVWRGLWLAKERRLRAQLDRALG